MSFHFTRSILALVVTLAPLAAVPPHATALAPAELVRDANLAPVALGSDPYPLAQVGGTILLGAATRAIGSELWRTDGSPGGTALVEDLWPGPSSGLAFGTFVVLGGVAYFVADDGVHGPELWRSDGTAAGTFLVKDIRSGPAGSSPDLGVVSGGVLVFSADSGNAGRELWKTDGTGAGTLLVRDIAAGTASSNPYGFTVLGGLVYFAADDGTLGTELWRSNGTGAGTTLVADILPGAAGSNPVDLISFTGALYFWAEDGVAGRELWRSNGSAAGTALFAEFEAGPAGSFSLHHTRAGNQLFFSLFGVEGDALAVTDGTAQGTRRIEFPPGSHFLMTDIAAAGDLALFIGGTLDEGFEPWRSDGTQEGTFLVRDILPGPGTGTLGELTEFQGAVFFAGRDGSGPGAGGEELWRSDGATQGTYRVRDIVPGPNGSSPEMLVAFEDFLLFAAGDAAGRELWRSDGTEAGTQRVKDIAGDSATAAGEPAQLTPFGAALLYSADDGVAGRELWRSDGTPGGTAMVVDINPGSAGSAPTGFHPFGGAVYFRASDGSSGTELWKTNGTAPGTSRVVDAYAGANGSTPVILGDIGGKLFFAAHDGTQPRRLWRSDGTTPGTAVFGGLQLSPTPSAFVLGGTLYFGASDGTSNFELWRTDGTLAGTQLVKDLDASPSPSQPRAFGEHAGTLYFSALTFTLGPYLWRSDGTADGTLPVSPLLSDGNSSSASFLTSWGGSLYFVGYDGTTERIFRTDGSAAATFALGSEYGEVEWLGVVGQSLVFAAQTSGSTQRRLFRSDGTIAGTSEIAPLGLTFRGAVRNGILFFGNTLSGFLGTPEMLFRSDGTAAGTGPLSGVSPFSGFTPNPPETLGADLFLPADELWVVRGAARCGNGVPNAGEACDDANAIEGDGCDLDCSVTGCGNGTITAGEQCDGGEACNTACSFNQCGDGDRRAATEACDDGNTVAGDCCDAGCGLEGGAGCPSPVPTMATPATPTATVTPTFATFTPTSTRTQTSTRTATGPSRTPTRTTTQTPAETPTGTQTRTPSETPSPTSTPGRGDYFTEFFTDGTPARPFDLENLQLTFTPDGSPAYYRLCLSGVDALPVDPNGGVGLALPDDGVVALSPGAPVSLYGVSYGQLVLGSNGFVALAEPGTVPSFADHFSKPGVSMLAADLNPAAKGSVTYQDLADRVVISFVNVPEYGRGGSNNFQLELFRNGVIRITYLNVGVRFAGVGLSEGRGAPADFVADDLSDGLPCVENLTELFEGDNDLAFRSFTFEPSGSPPHAYGACRTEIAALPVVPAGGNLAVPGDGALRIDLAGGATLPFFGASYASFYIGGNGYITFGAPDGARNESFANHFDLPRISYLFDNLNPAGGQVRFQQVADRAVVTAMLPEAGANPNQVSSQVEMFFDGRIRLSYLGVTIADGLAGLSRGLGIPPGFVESDLSALPPCGTPTVTPTLAPSPSATAISPGGTATGTPTGPTRTPTRTPTPRPEAVHEPDNTLAQAKPLACGESQVRALVGDVDWASVTLTTASALTVRAIGTDVILDLRDVGGALIEHQDEDFAATTTLIERKCGVNALPAGSYFVEVRELSGRPQGGYQLQLQCSACALPNPDPPPACTGECWLPTGLPRPVAALAHDRTDGTLYAASRSLHSLKRNVLLSLDAGASWEPVPGQPASFLFPVTDLGFASGRLFVATEDLLRVAVDQPSQRVVLAEALALRISGDGGATFPLVQPFEEASASAIAPARPAHLFRASIEGLDRSTDSGTTWHPADAGFAGIASTIAFHPRDPEVLLAGSGGDGGPASTLFRTADGGRAWSPSNDGLPLPLAPTAIVFDPVNPGRVFVATAGNGVFHSRDRGSSWQPLNGGLENLEVADLELVTGASGRRLYAATSKGVFALAPATPPCAGDCNGDGAVGAAEITALAARMAQCQGAPVAACGSSPACAKGDAAGDGAIDAADMRAAVDNAKLGCSAQADAN